MTKVKVDLNSMKNCVQAECFKVEDASEQEQKEYIERAEKLRINKWDDLVPVTGEEINPENHFCWYRVNSAEDVTALEEAYYAELPIEVENYPEIICVEVSSGEPYDFRSITYFYNLKNIIKESMQFWNALDYEMTLMHDKNKVED